MGTGFRGTFVISWSQSEIDGQKAADPATMSAGATWSWSGEAVRVDGPSAILRLDQADGETQIRKKAARMVRRMVGAAMSHKTVLDEADTPHPFDDRSFVVTNGYHSFTVTLIEVGNNARPLLMFLDELPPKGQDLWVVHHNLETRPQLAPHDPAQGVICFTPGTLIRTADGAVPVERLDEGDLIQTKDNGLQEIQWIGSRLMTGARLFALPKLRPIRIRPGALGLDVPDSELLVSPQHRMLLRGAIPRALFNTDEVLISARDLLDNPGVHVDTQVKEVTYYHLLMPRHEILFANGVATESFHPASAALSALQEDDRKRLLQLQPTVAENPNSYGAYARRNLTSSEAAIMMHEAA